MPTLGEFASENLLREPAEPDNFAAELLETKMALADKTAEVSEVKKEVTVLKQKLAGCLLQLETYRVKQTQTSPRIDREVAVERRKKDLEKKRKRGLGGEKKI